MRYCFICLVPIHETNYHVQYFRGSEIFICEDFRCWTLWNGMIRPQLVEIVADPDFQGTVDEINEIQ